MRSFANFNALVSVVKRDLGQVRQPALIVHPREDDMASLENAQYLQTHLGGLVDTLVLDNSYHMVTLDQQRHIVAERTESFVSWLRELRRWPEGEVGRRRRQRCRCANEPSASDPGPRAALDRRLPAQRSRSSWRASR